MVHRAMVLRAMTQRTHGIEGMRGVPRSRRDSASGRLKIGVGMSQAHANAAPRRFGNDFGRAVQFRSNRHHPNPAARRLPELLESVQFRSQQIFRRMHPAARMADEGPLQMNSEREGSTLDVILLIIILLAIFDCIRQPFECAQSQIHRSADGGWEITGDPMPREKLLDRRQRLGGIVHDVVSSAAVNVKINVTRRYPAITEIAPTNHGGSLSPAPSGNFEDSSLLDEHKRMLDGIRGSQ